MASNSAISISFKIEDAGGGFKKLTADAVGLRKVMELTVNEAGQLKKSLINLASVSTVIDSVSRSLSALQSVCKSLTDAYAVQIEAEKKLQTVMRQRMDATAAEIQSIKELAAAQQQIGVIGDEVQLSGAQQIATFLTQKASLDVLIPAMNNLLAQQKGLNATTQDAVSIGNLMGKAMQGQTSALTRVGIIFNEAQEKVMKYGSETERAAMLAEIIFLQKEPDESPGSLYHVYCLLENSHFHATDYIYTGRQGNCLNRACSHRYGDNRTACDIVNCDGSIG